MALHKLLISADAMEQDVWRFAKALHQQGHDFDLFVGLTRGGAQISIYLQEAFSLFAGKAKEYATVQVTRYTAIGKADETVRLGNLDCTLALIRDGSRVLIVDDIFDRGVTLKSTMQALARRIDKRHLHED